MNFPFRSLGTRVSRLLGLGGVLAGIMVAAEGRAQAVVFIHPVAATASSQWNSNYLANFTIDGSGLPANFTPDDAHAAYTQGNHWTTASGDVAGAFVTFDLGTDHIVNTLYLWNHLSTVPPAFSPHYAAQTFSLTLYDSDGVARAHLTDFSAQADVATAQVYTFADVEAVRSIRLTIDSNHGDPTLTGLAEVRFGFTPIPEPSTLALLLSGGLLAGTTYWRRRRRKS